MEPRIRTPSSTAPRVPPTSTPVTKRPSTSTNATDRAYSRERAVAGQERALGGSPCHPCTVLLVCRFRVSDPEYVHLARRAGFEAADRPAGMPQGHAGAVDRRGRPVGADGRVRVRGGLSARDVAVRGAGARDPAAVRGADRRARDVRAEADQRRRPGRRRTRACSPRTRSRCGSARPRARLPLVSDLRHLGEELLVRPVGQQFQRLAGGLARPRPGGRGGTSVLALPYAA